VIKVALKHWIYDYCINILFNHIKNNFSTFNIKQKFKVGEKYRIIEELGGNGYGRIYYDCVIINGDYEWFGGVFIDIKYGRIDLYKPDTVLYFMEKDNLTATVLVCRVKNIVKVIK
jgi:hypothetical protein